MENNIFSLLMAILPVFLYSFLVYYMVPKNFLSQRRARRYIVTGMISPMIVFAFHYSFPFLDLPLVSDNQVITFGYSAFFQVAIIEEVAKFLTFWWVFSQRKSAIHDLPIATMYYCMMASAGFAVVENISYLMNYGDQVLFTRAVSAIVLHMITGLIMGYYIQMGFSKIMMSEKYSIKEIFKMNFHKWRHIIFGITMATIVHGIYDLNLFLPLNIYAELFLFVILFFSLFLGKFMISEGIRLSKNLRGKNFNKDLEHF